MITIRNEDKALSLSARAGVVLTPGQVVKLAPGTASGDQPTVVLATIADLSDVTVQKFIVDYVQPDSLDVDFDINPSTQALTPIAKTIPSGAQCNIWYGTVVVAYHETLLPAGFKAANAREADKAAFDGDTGLPGKYASGAVDGLQAAKGFVYRVDGPEVTFSFTL
jgi:hypothetical protein